MVSTEVAIQQFPQTLEQYSTKVEDEQLEGIVGGIDRLRKQNPGVYDENAVAKYLQDRSKTLKGMVEEYFTASIANEFPLISNELFELKRHLTLKAEGKTWKLVRDDTEAEKEIIDVEKDERNPFMCRINVPLFAYTPLFDGQHTAKLGSFAKQRGYLRAAMTIEAKLPGRIGSNLKEAYRAALSHYFGVLSIMFKNPAVGDIMYAERSMSSNKERVDAFTQPEIGATWIPTSESLNVIVDTRLIPKRKNIDPAMILKVREKYFLIDTWRVDDEQPYNHFLREYSIGNLKGKVKS